MRGEESEVGDRRGHHHQLTVGLHAQRHLGPDPQAVDGLTVVVQRFLIRGHLGQEEPGVEPALLPDGGDPVIDVVGRGEVEDEIIASTQLDQRQGAVVHLVTILVAQRERAAGPGSGEQDAGLLETLAHRCHPVRQAAVVDAELVGRRGVVESPTERGDLVGAVDAVDTTAGEDVHAGAEHGVGGSPQHEHLDPGRRCDPDS